VSHHDPWAHNWVPHMCSVCVCVCIHTHTTTCTPTGVKNREDTDNTPIPPSVKNDPLRQAKSAIIDYLIPFTLVPQRWMHKLHIHASERICTPCSKRVRKCVCWCHNTYLTYTPAHAWCSKHLSKCMHTLRKKCTCTCACAPMQPKLLCYGNYCELILSLVRASCRLPFAARPGTVSTKSVARQEIRPNPPMMRSPLRCRTRLIRSSALVQACRPHPFCVWFAPETWPRGSLHQKFCFRHFFARVVRNITSFCNLLQHDVSLQIHCNMTSHYNMTSPQQHDVSKRPGVLARWQTYGPDRHYTLQHTATRTILGWCGTSANAWIRHYTPSETYCIATRCNTLQH